MGARGGGRGGPRRRRLVSSAVSSWAGPSIQCQAGSSGRPSSYAGEARGQKTKRGPLEFSTQCDGDLKKDVCMRTNSGPPGCGSYAHSIVTCSMSSILLPTSSQSSTSVVRQRPPQRQQADVASDPAVTVSCAAVTLDGAAAAAGAPAILMRVRGGWQPLSPLPRRRRPTRRRRPWLKDNPASNAYTTTMAPTAAAMKERGCGVEASGRRGGCFGVAAAALPAGQCCGAGARGCRGR